MRSLSLRSIAPAWIFAWAVAIFLPSALIAGFGLSPAEGAVPYPELPGAVWRVADEVGPFAKLLLGALLAAAFLVVALWPAPTRMLRVLSAAAAGAVAMLLTVALVPESWSRGFGVGLVGERFDPAVTGCYLIGAVVGGLFFAARRDG